MTRQPIKHLIEYESNWSLVHPALAYFVSLGVCMEVYRDPDFSYLVNMPLLFVLLWRIMMQTTHVQRYRSRFLEIAQLEWRLHVVITRLSNIDYTPTLEYKRLEGEKVRLRKRLEGEFDYVFG